ncbi:site-specific DNA-methyltransferase [Desulforamulus ferrireducens]|uniref:Site-specific DNA-methyltransferase n=1 Tax=Desulforamulus ferrireducens TaxID=1833852 RepID=A0A1S6IY83_9FIRM|nr:site-specific DNA-methyltransferase [Desulforamulus ferrireducens]AQS59710.1 site-specific DNA-methyltransferase [Desulforamulus ferrireducens]
MIETTLTGKTPDIGEENIKKLMTIFPEVVTEGKVDFEKLKQVLGEYVDDSNERYNFTWNGKGRALRLSQTPSLGTLRPCKEESKNWDTTQNLYIEGDNLEVLKLLQKSYYGKIKMIYIDPPYNTGKDFVYKDDFYDSIENYKRITGQIDGNGKPISTNTETSGRYHTDWLNMMYPRLRLARNLLSENGLIVINIDEHEVTNLHKLCTEVFGESNDLGTIIWDKRNPKGDAKGVSYQHEYILLFAKNKEQFFESCTMVRPKKNAKAMLRKAEQIFNKVGKTLTLDEANAEFQAWISSQKELSGGEAAYKYIDTNGEVYRTVSMAWPNNKKAPEDYFIPLIHPITRKPCPVPAKGWRYPSATMRELLAKNLIIFGKDETKQPERKYLLRDNMYENIPSLLYYGGSDTDMLFALGIPFDTPKVVNIVKEHIQSFTEPTDVILDFFSGSATTAHAVMQLNAEDGGNRRFIMVQLPEPTDEKSEAYKAGYKNICEIGKERIRRAGEKIKEEYKDKENIENLDIGFKVFKLDTSNIRKWQPDYDNLEQSLMDYVDNFVEGRTEFDVVYEIMLKYGLDLTYPVDEFTIAGKKVYSIGYGMLMICLDNEITTEVAKGILTKIKELSPESSRVVFKDNGFKSDSNKTNIKEILKSGGIEEFITI